MPPRNQEVKGDGGKLRRTCIFIGVSEDLSLDWLQTTLGAHSRSAIIRQAIGIYRSFVAARWERRPDGSEWVQMTERQPRRRARGRNKEGATGPGEGAK